MKLSVSPPASSEDARRRWSTPKSVRREWEICRWNWCAIFSRVLREARVPMFMPACFTDAPATTRSKLCSRLSHEPYAWPAPATAAWAVCFPLPKGFYDRHRGLRSGQSEFGEEGVRLSRRRSCGDGPASDRGASLQDGVAGGGTVFLSRTSESHGLVRGPAAKRFRRPAVSPDLPRNPVALRRHSKTP